MMDSMRSSLPAATRFVSTGTMLAFSTLSNCRILDFEGSTSQFASGWVHAAVADVDGDGRVELIVAGAHGVYIRSLDDLDETAAIPAAGNGQLGGGCRSRWRRPAGTDREPLRRPVVVRDDVGHLLERPRMATRWSASRGRRRPARWAHWLPTWMATAGRRSYSTTPCAVSYTLDPEFQSYVYLGDADGDVQRRSAGWN